MQHLKEALVREVGEEELLTYLALGAAAFKDGRPVFRPVVHTFVRGIPGAVMSFPDGAEPRLWLSAQDEIAEHEGQDGMWRPRVLTCTTCGQHYFEAYLKDFQFTGAQPEGGQLADGGEAYWEALDKDHGGQRLVVVDQMISQDEEADLEEENWSCPAL